ncbi:MAG TPA: Rap1a/Tai family immunity protein [Xanthobacteraceae bacterium]|nr:Rap1a/Tai family immunity protein [Xanthobacteraceae bacterium]
MLATAPLKAEGLDGAKLYEICEHNDPSSTENIVCAYYIKGFIEGMLFGDFSAKVTVGYCPPEDGISPETGRLIFRKFIQDNPKASTDKAGVAVGAALLSAFPCKKPN